MNLNLFSKLDLYPFERWEQLNSQAETVVRKTFTALDPKVQIQVFRNQGHALFDIFIGLKQFYPHKKSLVVFTEGSPYILPNLASFYREAYKLIIVKIDALQDVSLEDEGLSLKNLIASWGSDLLCVVWCSNDLFTGELYQSPQKMALKKKLLESRIPVVEMINAYTEDESQQHQCAPFEIQIFSKGQLLKSDSIAILGSRTKILTASAPFCYANEKGYADSEQLVVGAKKEILDFEGSISKKEGLKPHFKSDFAFRTWDRTVFSIEPVAGRYFLEELAKLLVSKIPTQDFYKKVSTLHLCDWGGFASTENHQQMSQIMLSAELVKISGIDEAVKQCFSSCIDHSKIV